MPPEPSTNPTLYQYLNGDYGLTVSQEPREPKHGSKVWKGIAIDLQKALAPYLLWRTWICACNELLTVSEQRVLMCVLDGYECRWIADKFLWSISAVMEAALTATKKLAEGNQAYVHWLGSPPQSQSSNK